MRGSYTIETKGAKIPLRFCTWSLSRFCEQNGNISLSGLFDLFAKNQVTIKHIIGLILAGAEYVCRKEGKPFSYTELEIADVVDEMGGISSEKVNDLIGAIVLSLAPESKEEETETEEKKISVGESSTPLLQSVE